MEIIATHVSSDFDSFAGMVAAKKLYPDAEIVLAGSINQNVRKFIAIHEDDLPVLRESGEINSGSVSKMIIIDTSIASRLGPFKSIADKKDTEIIIYDHHQKSPEDISHGKKVTKSFGATTTILVDIIKKRKIKITPLEATLFSLGIYEDTGSFTFPNTSPADFEIAAYLRRHGANLFVISKFLNPPLTDEQHVLLEKLIAGSKKINVHEKSVILSSAKTDNFVEGLSIVSRKLGQVEDIDIVFCWVKMKDKTYIVARSDDRTVDVSRIMEVVNGGGHSQAASAILKDVEFAEIESKIVSSLYKNIEKPLLAKDIMSFPIRVINEDESINNVNEILKKYGHTGIPIVDKNNMLVGIVTRKDVDKAIKHGLSHAPVKGFKSRGLITTGPNTTVEEVQRMMIENGIGRIPIVQKGEVTGIVTRKDILRFLHGTSNIKSYIKTSPGQNFNLSASELNERLTKSLPPDIIRLLKQASDIAKNLKVKVYLVGGIVRDILLGIPNLDIDIVVEGDGIVFAEKLGLLNGARTESYEKFKTAVIILDETRHIDVASSRIEYYQKPAALPDVEPGNISQDLARRDFTINTLAISLNNVDFGCMLDYFGGRKDLKEKRIKVLHKLSFIEDPTRIFRAVRFEQRLGFKMDQQTEKLAVSSLGMDVVNQLSGIRIRDEIISILKEKEPWNAIKRLHGIDALRRIGIEVQSVETLVNFIKKVIKSYGVLSVYTINNFELWRALVSVMFLESGRPLIAKWCSRMKIRNKDHAVIKETAIEFKLLNDFLSKKIKKNSVLHSILKGKPQELLLVLSASGKNQFDNISRFYSIVQKIKPFITGNDLKTLNFAPSKNYRIILDKILEMKLDGLLDTRVEELKAASEIIRELKATSRKNC